MTLTARHLDHDPSLMARSWDVAQDLPTLDARDVFRDERAELLTFMRYRAEVRAAVRWAGPGRRGRSGTSRWATELGDAPRVSTGQHLATDWRTDRARHAVISGQKHRDVTKSLFGVRAVTARHRPRAEIAHVTSVQTSEEDP